MTGTLERFHQSLTRLQVLRSRTSNGIHEREVLLVADGTGRPVEFGAITVQLSPLPKEVREQVLQMSRPLGGLLREQGIEYLSRPKAFIRVEADRRLADLLELKRPTDLYGRCNSLLMPDGRVLADIVEILPP